jgi:hypothetical protein
LDHIQANEEGRKKNKAHLFSFVWQGEAKKNWMDIKKIDQPFVVMNVSKKRFVFGLVACLTPVVFCVENLFCTNKQFGME